MPDVKEFHFHMELLVQMDIRRHGMAEGARMTFFHSGQLRPLGGAHFPLPRAANERGGRLVASRWRPTWKISSKTHSRWMGKVLPRKSTWEAYYCVKMGFLGNRLPRRRTHGFKEISILYWNSLDILHPGSGEVIGSLPGSCRISWNAI